MSAQPHLSPPLARAARAITQVSVERVAERANLSIDEVRGFETGTHALDPGPQDALRAALEYFGAVFIEEDQHGGAGVREKFDHQSAERVQEMEDEGGPVAEDDVTSSFA